MPPLEKNQRFQYNQKFPSLVTSDVLVKPNEAIHQSAHPSPAQL